MFIGRKQELQFLENKYNSKEGQLIILYGRRRVGKTETLREFCKDKQHIFYSCREISDKLQLRSFSEKLLKENIPATRYIKEFSDWETALKNITDLPYGDKKKLLIIDEFPYMCRGNRSIPSILQNLWDECFKDENVMIVLCGSAMSFIEKELLAERDVSSEITRDGSNEYTAHLYMSSNHRRVFSIDIQYASRNEAREAARIWQENADEIFSYIYDRLNSEK